MKVEGLIFCKLIMYTGNQWNPLDLSCLEMCESPLKYPTLGLGLYCCCLIAWAMVHRNGGSPFVFTLFPNGSFPPIVLSSFFPNNSTYFVVCPNFWRPLSFQKRIISPYSSKPVGDSTKTQYYLAIRYGIKGPRMFRYKAFGKWLCYPMRLESRDSGVRVQRHW